MRAVVSALARYNSWMNAAVRAAGAKLAAPDRHKNVGATFKSLHGTLNHIMVADRMWLARFVGRPVPTDPLDAILYTDEGEFWATRDALDAEIQSVADGRSDDAWAAILSVPRLSGRVLSRPAWLMALHMLNHQTYHRGQATTILMQNGVDPGPTDLPVMPGADAIASDRPFGDLAGRDVFSLLARYNAWSNATLYEQCAGLDDAARTRDLGAFFKSIHGTLGHILVGDRIWLARFRGQPVPMVGLGDVPYARFDDLRQARRDLDADVVAFAESLDDGWLAQPFSFVSAAYRATFTRATWLLLLHMFNHQTHHRGQATVMISQLGLVPGETDLISTPGLD
ncbi:MAG: DinB family protein [Rhodospirillaceae bacterium]|nr:DinB family protein [Rhodospirillaceae bacterium]